MCVFTQNNTPRNVLTNESKRKMGQHKSYVSTINSTVQTPHSFLKK